METRIELISEDQHEEIIVRCYSITDEIQNMTSFIENDKKIIGYKRGTAYPLKMSDIYLKNRQKPPTSIYNIGGG